MTTVVDYIRRKKESPFTLVNDVYRHNHLAIADGSDSVVWYPTFSGNAKQRRQQKRKLLRDLNA